MAEEFIIRTRALSKHYGFGGARVEALCDLSMDVPPSQFLAVMGPSGSGKTTLLNLVGGLDLPSAGTLQVCGVTLSELGEGERTRFRRHVVAFVFQDFGLIAGLTVWENVALALALARMPIERSRISNVIEQVGLSRRTTHWPSELSGGEMQRVAVARALVTQPRVLIADEPTGNLDSDTGSQIVELLQRQSRRNHMTVIVATHNLELARQADRIIRLRDGRLCIS